MCVCVYVGVCLCTCECIYVYIRDVYERAEKEENTAMMCQPVCVWMCVWMCVYVYVCVCVCVCVWMCGCAHGSSFSRRSGTVRVSRAPVISSFPALSQSLLVACSRAPFRSLLHAQTPYA